MRQNIRPIQNAAPVLLVICVLFSLVGLAEEREIYHCEDEYGRMALSDRPCDPDLVFVEMKTITVYTPYPARASTLYAGETRSGRPQGAATAEVAKRNDSKQREDCEKQQDSPWLNTFDGDCK